MDLRERNGGNEFVVATRNSSDCTILIQSVPKAFYSLS